MKLKVKQEKGIWTFVNNIIYTINDITICF